MSLRIGSIACAAIILLCGVLLLAGGAHAQETPAASLLTPHPSQVSIEFGNSRNAESRAIRLETVPSTPAMPTAVVLGDLESTEGGSVVPMSDVSVTATNDQASDTLLVDVTIDPSIDAWNAGDYSGILRISGDGLQVLTVPIEVSFRSGPSPMGQLVAVLVVLAGLGLGALFQSTNTGNETVAVRASVTGLKRRVLKAAPWLTGVATIIIVAIVGFNSEYLEKPTFGAGGFSDWLALGLWGFAAGLGGKAVKDFLTAKVS